MRLTELESKLIKENKKLLLQLDQQIQLNHLQSQQIQQLKEQIDYLTKKLFGSSSEKTKYNPNQLSLFEDPKSDEPSENEETLVEKTEEISYHRRKKVGHKADLTKDLPIEEIHCELHDDDCKCDYCGEQMKPIGKKVIREEVCFIPAKLYKKVYYQHAYKCHCLDETYEAQPIKCAAVPKAPIQRSFVGATVLAWLFHQKFDLSLPIYRQEKE